MVLLIIYLSQKKNATTRKKPMIKSASTSVNDQSIICQIDEECSLRTAGLPPVRRVFTIADGEKQENQAHSY